MIQDVKVYTATITTTATPDYADLDQIGVPVALEGVQQGVIESVVVVDIADQAPVLNIHFFSEEPTVASADNAAVSIVDAQVVDKYLGSVAIAAADYANFTDNRAAVVKNIGLAVKATGADLYMLVQAGGAYNASGTSDLTVKVGIRRG